jgi:hypothetical protein
METSPSNRGWCGGENLFPLPTIVDYKNFLGKPSWVGGQAGLLHTNLGKIASKLSIFMGDSQ